MIRDIFDTIGLTPTLELLLILILAAMLLKCVLVWVANKRVGYTVAHLTTKLRLQMLRAFILARWEFHLSQPIGKLAAAMGTEVKRTANSPGVCRRRSHYRCRYPCHDLHRGGLYGFLESHIDCSGRGDVLLVPVKSVRKKSQTGRPPSGLN